MEIGQWESTCIYMLCPEEAEETLGAFEYK